MAGFRKLRLMKVAPSANRRVGVCGLIYAFFSLFPLTTVALPASAKVLISVDKSTQHMFVSVDGVSRYRFATSTGRAGYGTPNGTYRPERLAASWFSKLYYNSPMPHSIFFHGGYAIHGTYEINRLGGPASHGCIRLHPANAAALFDLVKSEGMAATTIVVSGTNPVVASGPAPSPRPHRGGESPPYHEHHKRDYGRERLANEGRYRRDYGWERPAYSDTYRPDYGRSDYHWRPEPRAFPSFNSY
jgi:L,D-transpeptidase catalytic domain